MSQFLKVPKDFPKVLTVLIGMNMQIFYISRQISSMRKEIFTERFMKENFGDLHRMEVKEEIQLMGYPDSGDNLYSQKLSYRDWYRFNVLQKIHKDYLNNISFATLSVVAAGLINPNYGVGVGSVYILGRALYEFFYRKYGTESKGMVAARVICASSVLAGVGIFIKEYFFK